MLKLQVYTERRAMHSMSVAMTSGTLLEMRNTSALHEQVHDTQEPFAKNEALSLLSATMAPEDH